MTVIVPEALQVTIVGGAQNFPTIESTTTHNAIEDYDSNKKYHTLSYETDPNTGLPTSAVENKQDTVYYTVSADKNVSETDYIGVFTALGDVPKGIAPDNPDSGAMYWGFVGVKNEDAFLDKYLNTSTLSEVDTPLQITFSTGISDTIACLNVDCRYVYINYYDGSDDVEYIIDLRQVRDIWSEDSYPDIINESEAFFNVPLNTGVEFTLTFTNGNKTSSTGVVGVGKVIAGRKRQIGETMYPVDVSLMTTYTKETESGAGAVYNNLQYTYKDVSYNVSIENSRRELCYRLFESVAGKNVLFVPTLGDNYGWYDGDTSIISYGFFQDFNMTLEGAVVSEFNISVEGIR
jgi:hypothetical protein